MRLIDADALLKTMEEERQYLLARGQTGAEHIFVHHCLPLIDNAPTVAYPFEKFRTMFCGTCQANMRIEPERPKGEWIKDNSGNRFCSECGSCALYHEIGTQIESRFCPNCGAKMRGENK